MKCDGEWRAGHGDLVRARWKRSRQISGGGLKQPIALPAAGLFPAQAGENPATWALQACRLGFLWHPPAPEAELMYANCVFAWSGNDCPFGKCVTHPHSDAEIIKWDLLANSPCNRALRSFRPHLLDYTMLRLFTQDRRIMVRKTGRVKRTRPKVVGTTDKLHIDPELSSQRSSWEYWHGSQGISDPRRRSDP
jgi:hypothetical protein